MIQSFLGLIPVATLIFFFWCHAREEIDISFSSGTELFAAISFEFNTFIPDLKETTSVTRNMSITTGSTAWYLNGIGGSNFNNNNSNNNNWTTTKKAFSCSVEQQKKRVEPQESLFSDTIMPLNNLIDFNKHLQIQGGYTADSMMHGNSISPDIPYLIGFTAGCRWLNKSQQDL